MTYRENIRALLTHSENAVLKRLSTPQRIQDYLDSLPFNFETRGETYMSPRRVLKAKTAHCFEGALLAAAALAYHGQKPLLMDLQTTFKDDDDHVVTLFRQNGHWGAISKTNHAVLRWRDPIYKTIRELALSYFHEYFLKDGRKSLRAYSAPFDLSQVPPDKWVTAEEDLDFLVTRLDNSRHFPTMPKKNSRLIRKATAFEIRAMDITEWKAPKIRKSRR